nr:reverse transcriptase domain-containing protein [Tanacetum cinerariifolium]
MSSHGWEKEKEASTHDWGRMSHRDTGARVEKEVPAGQQKTPTEGKKTLGSSFEATSRTPVNVSRKLKRNGMPLTAQAAGRALGTKELLATKEVHKRSCGNSSYQAKGMRANRSLHGKIQGRKHACQWSIIMYEDIEIHARPAENRNKNKFCEFHRDKGHNTDECIHIRKQIEEAVKSGQLSHLVKKIKQGGKRGEHIKTVKKRKPPNKEKATAIFMVQPWQRITRQKTTHSFFVDQEISFSRLRNNDGQENSIVIKAEVEGHLIHRMRRRALNERPDKLYGCQILVTIQWYHRPPRSKKNPRGPIYRSWNAKIPSRRRNSDNPQQYHNTSGMQNGGRPQDVLPPREPVATEGIKVAIHLEYLEQTVTIGGSLSGKGRMKLCNLLKKNLDIFAWKPTDMTDVPRSIAEHCLNIHEGCQPIRQKRKGQAPDRNKAIQEEVTKSVEAKIIREVHYHDWLSNPVMVKKHDGS